MNMLRVSLRYLSFVIIFFMGCQQDPEYLLDFDRIDSAPTDVAVSINDAFSLKISVTLNDDINIDGLSVYRLSKDDNNVGYSEFDKIMDVESIDSSIITIIDSSAVFGKYNFYTITGYLGEVESFFTEPVYCYFQLNSPDVSVDIIEYGIQSNIQLQYEFMDGVEVLRINDLDTLTQYIFNDGSEIFNLVDSLRYDYNSPLDSFETLLHEYWDIKPNVDYVYQIRSYQDKEERIYSPPFISNSVRYEILSPGVTTSAITDTSFRIYCEEESSLEYDSIFVLIHEGSSWSVQSAYLLSQQPNHNGNILIDVMMSESFTHKVAFKNANYHFLSQLFEGKLLSLPGFTLVESGDFIWGCVANDQQCNDDEYPSSEVYVNSFYMGIFEVTEHQFNSPGQWEEGFDSKPIEEISFNNALEFCNDLNSIYPDYEFYLPTEIEWEYAAKVNYSDQINTIYPWGNNIDIFNANYGFQNQGPISIGSYDYPSFQGQYDMAGNVMEWVNNCYDEQLIQNNDEGDCWKVAKGGAYWSDAEDLRISKRYHLPADQGFDGVGFRVAMKINN